MRKTLFEHLRRYWVVYLTLTGVYVAGIVFGAWGVSALGRTEADDLTKFLNSLLTSQPAALDPEFLKFLARDTLIMMAGIWLLGLTVIGAPLVYLIVFVRGFILGFTVSFFIEFKGLLGLGLVLTTILLPALLNTAVLLLGAGLATIFSMVLLRGKARGESLRREFLHYTLAAAVVCSGAVIVGIAQGYFSQLGVRLFGL